MTTRNYLRRERKQTNVTQKDIAHLLGGTDSSVIYKVEEGLRQASLDLTILYNLLFSKSVVELFPQDVQRVKLQLKERIPGLILELEELKETPDTRARIDYFEFTLNELIKADSSL
ncbi:MAG: hypothetical protein ACPGSD_17215 [Flavobacteriales bacterium]